jgi:hypothetical protein
MTPYFVASLLHFTPTKGDRNGPEWSRVTLEDGVRIVGTQEVRNFVGGALENVLIALFAGLEWCPISDRRDSIL